MSAGKSITLNSRCIYNLIGLPHGALGVSWRCATFYLLTCLFIYLLTYLLTYLP